MRLSILIPHYGTGKMTAYAIAQLLKFKGNHEINIAVIDNNAGDGSIKYLDPFLEHITVVDYPKDLLQSHGVAFDWVLPHIKTDLFFTMESDSFPTMDGWLDYYERIIDNGYDFAASVLKLSGGQYGHPCGAIYKKSDWQLVYDYCGKIEYYYFPNMAMKEGFACHLMVHENAMEKFLDDPDGYIELSNSYKPYNKFNALWQKDKYLPVVGPFHSGMGRAQESVKTYGSRTIESEVPDILLNNKSKLIYRVGYEPGQYLCYMLLALGKKMFEIPTNTKWIDGKIGQQQEYTINAAGFHHCWGISAYKDIDPNDPIAKIKQALPEQLYNSLPEHQKIKE
jgi:hypothetical protein